MTQRRATRPGDRTEARFDAELSRAARGLVSEDLPRGVLDAALAPGAGLAGSVRGRRPVPLFAGTIAALVLLLASVIALAPGGFPPASPSPSPSPSPAASPAVHGAFRPTIDIRADFMHLRYSCAPGSAFSSIGPSPSDPLREGVVCTAPADAGPYISVVIVSEAADGRPVEIHAKADLTEADTPAARSEIAVPLAKSAAIAASGQAVGNALAQWVLDTIRTLEPSGSESTEVLGFSMQLLRNPNGGYQLFVRAI
ncbi:MAG TPA: hypothetical protein VJ850_04805 [Candidatus Limnocylindrales bacterium]|nr:hypothetical protein [Candidatus Limnocylindrales bacterium]